VALPEASQFLDQDSEWCVVERDGAWREVRFHDYGALYEIPGLYEKLFTEMLRCHSPRVVTRALVRECERVGRSLRSLRVLDMGAGNGMVGEELVRAGVGEVVGLDILPEAKVAAQRDRPGVYSDYVVADLTAPNDAVTASLRSRRLNCLVTVAALGYDDVPARAFLEALRLLEDGALVAFNIKEDFLSPFDGSGFGGVLRRLYENKTLKPIRQRRYRHRNATSGEPLYYVLVLAEKLGPIPS
jgi:SAM-dependent methyltransferase